MIGQAKLITGIGSIASSFNAFITPSILVFIIPGSKGSGSSGWATMNVNGGTEPFTYLWTLEQGTSMTISSPTSFQTYFSTDSSKGDEQFAVFRCTVTDSFAVEQFDLIEVEAHI